MAQHENETVTPEDELSKKICEIHKRIYRHVDEIEAARLELEQLKNTNPQPQHASVTIRQLDLKITHRRREVDKDLGELLKLLDEWLGHQIVKNIPICGFTDSAGLPISEGRALSDITAARLTDQNLTDVIHNLTGLITMAHIREEMDSQKYMGRVDKAFEKLADTSKRTAKTLAGDVRLKIGQWKGQISKAIPAGWLQGHNEHRKKFTEYLDRLDEIDNLLKSLYSMTGTDLVAFCQPGNRDYAKMVTREAAVRAEKAAVASWLVLLMTLIALVLGNVAITRSANFFLMEHRIVVLILAAGAVMTVSVMLGLWYRGSRVNRLNALMHRKLDELTALTFNPWPEQNRSCGFVWIRGAFRRLMRPDRWVRNLLENVNGLRVGVSKLASGVFPDLRLSSFAKGPIIDKTPSTSTLFAMKEKDDRCSIVVKKAFVVSANVGAVAVMFFVLLFSQRASSDLLFGKGEQYLLGQAANGTLCEISRGQVIHVDDDYVTVRKVTKDKANFAQIERQIIRRIDTELPATMNQQAGANDCNKQRWSGGARTTSVSNSWSLIGNIEQIAAAPRPAESTVTAGLIAISDGLAGIAQDIARPIIPVLQPVPAESLPGLYVVNLTLDGRQVPTGDLRNAMLLPLFRAPVAGVDPIGPQGAYEFGRASLTARTADGRRAAAFLDGIFQPIYRCVGQGGTISLDIAGYASQGWRKPGPHDPAQLNLHLAEGRRAALLDLIWAGARPLDGEAAGRILIRDAAGEFMPLDQVMASGQPGHRFVDSAQGTGPDLMRQHLAGLIGDPEDQPFGEDLRELLNRSALIQIAGASGPGCAVPPLAGQDQPQDMADAAPAMRDAAALAEN